MPRTVKTQQPFPPKMIPPQKNTNTQGDNSDSAAVSSSGPVSGGEKEKKKRILKRRKLNLEATLNAYENRIKSLPREDLLALENAWLSSYDVWDTIPFDKMEEEIRKRHGTSLDNNAYRLFQVVTEKEIPIAGITSERQSNGTYIAQIPVEGGRAQTKVMLELWLVWHEEKEFEWVRRPDPPSSPLIEKRVPLAQMFAEGWTVEREIKPAADVSYLVLARQAPRPRPGPAAGGV